MAINFKAHAENLRTLADGASRLDRQNCNNLHLVADVLNRIDHLKQQLTNCNADDDDDVTRTAKELMAVLGIQPGS
jgi:ribosome assembly protein YihI (activator of Der GTPase)